MGVPQFGSVVSLNQRIYKGAIGLKTHCGECRARDNTLILRSENLGATAFQRQHCMLYVGQSVTGTEVRTT